MESTVTHSTHPAWWMQAYAWADARRQQLLYGGVAVVVVGLIVAYFIYHRGQRQATAAEALSRVAATALSRDGKEAKPEDYLKVAAEYAGTSAAGQALLRAATAYFADGKYAEAQTQFERFVRDFRESPLVGQALFGVAASLDAQGKTAEAEERYKSLVDRRQSDSAIPQAKLKLGHIYETQNKLEQAQTLYQEVLRSSPYGATGGEARMHLEALLSKHPELAEVKVAATNAPSIKLGTP